MHLKVTLMLGLILGFVSPFLAQDVNPISAPVVTPEQMALFVSAQLRRPLTVTEQTWVTNTWSRQAALPSMATANAQTQAAVSYAFRLRHPEFNPASTNIQMMSAYLAGRQLPWTLENLNKAYDSLKHQLIPKPKPVKVKGESHWRENLGRGLQDIGEGMRQEQERQAEERRQEDAKKMHCDVSQNGTEIDCEQGPR